MCHVKHAIVGASQNAHQRCIDGYVDVGVLYPARLTLTDSRGAVSDGPDACRRGAAALISLVVRKAGVVPAELGGMGSGRTYERKNNNSL